MTVVTITKGVGLLLGAGVISEVIYQTYLWFHRRQSNKTESSPGPSSEVNEVLFFPDSQVACKAFFTSEDGCAQRSCRFTHEKNSLSRLYQFLLQARESLDVCVFVLCCADLVDVLVSAHKRGVRLRVICDDEQVDITGSQIWRLRREGVFVRTDSSSYLMHHKFVLVDRKVLINGSFNWTRQAISGNQENLIITNNTTIVQPFVEEFEKLWKLFDPSDNVSER